MLRWNDGSTEQIQGTYITQGTYPEGSMWAMNPLVRGPRPDRLQRWTDRLLLLGCVSKTAALC